MTAELLKPRQQKVAQCRCGCARSAHIFSRGGHCALCGVCQRYRVRTEPPSLGQVIAVSWDMTTEPQEPERWLDENDPQFVVPRPAQEPPAPTRRDGQSQS